MFISYCLIIIALVQRLQRSVGHHQPPSAACTAYVCSSGVYSLYWIKGNNVAWFYVETNMRLNRIRHRHYPTLQYSNKIMGPAHHICTATDKLSNAVKTPRPDTNPFYFEVFKLRNYKRGLHAFIV